MKWLSWKAGDILFVCNGNWYFFWACRIDLPPLFLSKLQLPSLLIREENAPSGQLKTKVIVTKQGTGRSNSAAVTEISHDCFGWNKLIFARLSFLLISFASCHLCCDAFWTFPRIYEQKEHEETGQALETADNDTCGRGRNCCFIRPSEKDITLEFRHFSP